MAHIPMGDTNILWNETKEHNWQAFQKTLQAHKGKTNGISDNLIDMMMAEVKSLESSKKPYPDSPQGLNEVLNQNLPAEK